MGQCLARGNAKDLVLPPPDSEEFIFLTRRVGYTKNDWQHLQTNIEQHMKLTKEFFERTFGALQVLFFRLSNDCMGLTFFLLEERGASRG